jgi:hypothetical protein
MVKGQGHFGLKYHKIPQSWNFARKDYVLLTCYLCSYKVFKDLPLPSVFISREKKNQTNKQTKIGDNIHTADACAC